jgi:hypothetical protein
VKPPLLLAEFVREKRRGVLVKLPGDPPVVKREGIMPNRGKKYKSPEVVVDRIYMIFRD